MPPDHSPAGARRLPEWAMSNLVHDRWLVRPFARSAGFAVERFDSHGFVQTHEAGCMVGLLERGADLLAATGRIDKDLAEAHWRASVTACRQRLVLLVYRIREPDRTEAELAYSVATSAPVKTTGPVGAPVGDPPFGSRLMASVALPEGTA